MSLVSKYGYYARSIVTLLTGFRDPVNVVRIFLGLAGDGPTEVALKESGLRFSIRSAMDAWVIKETCIDQDYLWAIGRLQDDWRIIDIGAGLGDFTVFAAKECPRGVVHAYEPYAQSFNLLTANLALNQIANAVPTPEAVASKHGRLNIDATLPEAVRVRTAAGADGPSDDTVAAISLAEALDRLPGAECDFMKVDCEGGEFDIVMNSPPDVLRRVKRMSLETHDGVVAAGRGELAEYLRQHGFEVRVRPNPVHAYLAFLYAERRGL